jgi:hypothetical protein
MMPKIVPKIREMMTERIEIPMVTPSPCKIRKKLFP